jgi:hypothetical protein
MYAHKSIIIKLGSQLNFVTEIFFFRLRSIFKRYKMIKMRKILLLAGAALLAGSVSAQILLEDFESGSLPSGWAITTSATDGGWNVGNSATLGSGAFPFDGNSTQFAGTNDDQCNCDKSNDFLYSSAVDLTAQTGTVYLKYNQFYYDAAYQGAQEIGTVEVSTDGGSSYAVLSTMVGFGTWNVVTLDLSAYVGQNIMIAFRYNDGAGWTYGMGIDDISVFVPANEDYTLTGVDLPNYFSLANGSLDIVGIMTNNGADVITSMDVEYIINGGAPVTGSLTGLSISPLASYDFTHPTAWTPAAENIYSVELKITAVNGLSDADVSDNMLAQDVNVFTTSYPRTVLYETFTSSTCGPCVAGNANFEGIIANIPSSEYASVKYQMSWPGAGDPYNTLDGNDRRTYYQISAVPGMEIDGGWDGNSNSFTQELHDDAGEVPAFISLWAQYTVNVADQKVTTCVTIESMKDLGSATLHMAIKEHLTIENVGSNGETEFSDVVKKMVPSSAGQSVAITAGMSQQICEEYTFKGTYRLPNSAADLINDASEHSVEEFTDLGVVVWMQDATKMVLNATNAVSAPLSVGSFDSQNNQISLSPNPAVETTTVAITTKDASVASVNVINVVGKSVLNLSTVQLSQGLNKIELNTTSLNGGVYFVEVTINGEVSTSQLVVQK